jgi:Fe2+ or Zn2+ uptake regulation protein
MCDGSKDGMNICDKSNHGQIVHIGPYCGACDKIKDLQDDWKQLREELKEATENLKVAYKTIEQMEDANGKVNG